MSRKQPNRGATRKPDVTAQRDALAAERLAERKASADPNDQVWSDFRQHYYAQSGVRLPKTRPWSPAADEPAPEPEA